MTAASGLSSSPVRSAQASTRLVFFIAGFASAAWAPLVPFAKQRAGLDDATLGLLLLCLGIGSLVAMPFSGALAARFGCRRVLVAGSVALCAALPLLATLSALPWLALALAAFGAALGMVDSVMNIQAVIVERESGRAMMSGFHGLFSVGGIAGAAGASALLGAGLSPLATTGVVVACILAALLAAVPGFLNRGSASSGPAFALPRGAVLFLGVLACVVFLAEGAMLDWSAVFLVQVCGLDPAYGGLGYAAFALTMTTGRLTGDAVVQRLGGPNVILFGGLCAAAGFAVATLAPVAAVALLGYALVGAGCANIVPVLFTQAGRQKDMPESVAVPALTTVGYAGVLAGPAIIGFVAHASSLPTAFLLLACALCGVGAAGRTLRTRQ